MLSERECLAALPPKGFLAQYVRNYASQETDAHVGYHIGCGLAALTQVVPGHLEVRFAGSRIRGNIFIMLVGESAARKGSALDLIYEVLDNSELTPGEEPASQEALMVSLLQRPKQLLMYQEFGNFLSASKNGPGSAIKTVFNKAFDCNPLGNATVGAKRARQNSTVKNPRLSLLAGCTPEYLSWYTEPVDWTGGFFSRFFYLNATRTHFKADPIDDPSARQACIDMLTELRDRGESDKGGDSVCLGLDSTASRLWSAWSLTVEQRHTQCRFPGMITRSMAFARKIALLLGCDYGAGLSGINWKVGIAELEPAIALAELHIKSAMELSESINETPEMRSRFAVLAQISEDAPTPLSEIIAGSRIINWRVKQILNSLEEEKIIESLDARSNGEDMYRRIARDQTISVTHLVHSVVSQLPPAKQLGGSTTPAQPHPHSTPRKATRRPRVTFE